VLRNVDAWRRDARWGSGAAVAAVAAVSGLLAHLSLRADSVRLAAGSAPGWPALLIGGVLLSLVLWPLAARSTRVSALAGVLLVAQFGTHALALLAAGAPVTDPRGLICCPPTEATRDGLVGQLTAQAGWTLVAVQVLACVLLAAAIRGSRDGADLVAFAVALAAAVLGSVALLGGRVLIWLGVRSVATPSWPPVPAAAPTRIATPGAFLARRSSRRGPPARSALVQASAAPRPALSLAAG
jgi:hypothetical protein